MKVTVIVGNVTVTVEGLDYTRGQVRGLLGSVYATACLMAQPEEDAANPVGFAAHVERSTGLPPEYQFTDDEDRH